MAMRMPRSAFFSEPIMLYKNKNAEKKEKMLDVSGRQRSGVWWCFIMRVAALGLVLGDRDLQPMRGIWWIGVIRSPMVDFSGNSKWRRYQPATVTERRGV